MGASEIADWARALNNFKNSGCTDASPIATIFCALVDKWGNTGTLPGCGPKISDVFNYPEKIRMWADSTAKENLRFDRQSKQLVVTEVVMKMRELKEASGVETPPK